ncbi:MAG: glycosyltransferase family 39 protein, partial [Planctomycetaceae bacterium]|nr:glycosyltransferase family 39 protein [Planctomycetaceae bacterium]
MSQNRLAADTWLMLAITVCGLWLRFASLNALCVEHFDEGVYASTLWYNDDFGTDYPGRDFYAPPLLPTMIAAGQATLGDHLAPFWFSLLTGTLTIPVIWWFTRSFFGKAAGLFAATTIALSDYHIIYSRMAMTDVPALLFTLLAIGLALRGINSISTRHMAAAGFCCGLAWWTKYTGWLPLAVVGSGSMVWWFWKGRRRIRFVSLCRLQLTMAATTLITFSPWWMALQDVGGLSAVSQNQAGYVSGFSVWTSQLATQLANQKLLDGRFGHIALLAGMLIAGVWRWKKAAGSTWNAACPQSPRTAGTLPTTPGADPQPTAVEMPPWRV